MPNALHLARTMFFARVALASCLAAYLPSCKEAPVPPFKIAIHVDADPGQPQAEVPILFQGKQVKVTDAAGNASIESSRADGEELTLVVSCPPDTGPAEPVKVRVQRVEGRAATKFARSCKPQIRSVGVIVRADNGPNLPVMYLGREVARTDASGAAHFGMKLRAGEAINITLATGTDEKVKPRNPVVPLTVSGDDEVKLINVRFEREKPRPIIRVVPTATGPKQF